MTKTKLIKYTKEEVDILTECIKANPGNIKQACDTAKTRIKKELKVVRTISALENKYHTTIKPNTKLFQIRGEKSSLPTNVKNTPRIKYSPKLNIIMELIDKLSEEDKKKLVLNTFSTLV